MRIGILSDTHDNLGAVDAAVRQLNSERVDLVLHAGDYVSPFVIPRLANLHSPMIGVMGNNDGDHRLLSERFAEHEALSLRGGFAAVTAGGMTIGLLHGDDRELLQALIGQKAFNVVVHGHTHRAEVREFGATLVINPGEACGYLTGQPTIAVLDTSGRDVELLSL
ncbi:metallophosphoesterase [Methanoculleus sp. Wushi-C6]|uniref:Phosphoesterase n=1 Tax=Methanoculleus caldifontis TaxID=2651577 RepID=A0ABU3X1Y8_9EURY|nr:metallophosphoesterase [Methanoculleus sp. Wushi-C6]MDV2482062.1 metallophosphoesterase [Methanoculleus sp. Wushi-C6]